MARLLICGCLLLLFLCNVPYLATASLSVNSVYVIVDPSSSQSRPILLLKDHYNDRQTLNSNISGVYIKGTGSKWHQMEDTGYSYQTAPNLATLIPPLSLKISFNAHSNVNYTWSSFLSNLDGSTIYHLLIQHRDTMSPTVSPTAASISTTETSTTTMQTTPGTSSTEQKPISITQSTSTTPINIRYRYIQSMYSQYIVI